MVDEPIRTIVVDDHPDIRLLLRLILGAADSPCEVVGEASNGQEAIDLFESLRPDCTILDVLMPGMDGIEAASRIHEIDPDQHVVFCSAHVDGDALDLRTCDTFVPKKSVDRLPSVVRELVR